MLRVEDDRAASLLRHPHERRKQRPAAGPAIVGEGSEEGGSIINISSQASLIGGGGGSLAPYGAAKAGLNHMTRSLGSAWGRKVRVNCVSLGYVRTEAMVGLLIEPEREAAVLDGIPVGRMGTPEEVGGICLFLASEAGAYINGATIWADGGGGF